MRRENLCSRFLGPATARQIRHAYRRWHRSDVCLLSLHSLPRHDSSIPMKRPVVFIVFFLILGLSLAGLYWSQRRPKSTAVSPNAILNMAADAQRDVTRLPMHFTRISDEQEINIGKELASRYAMQTRKLTPEEQGQEKYVQRVGRAVAL